MELPPLDNVEPEFAGELIGGRSPQNPPGRQGSATSVVGQCLVMVGNRPHRGAFVQPIEDQPDRHVAIPQGAVFGSSWAPPDVDQWPEGCRLLVEPLPVEQTFELREEDWEDTPEAIADWLRWYDSLEPLEFTPEEAADMAAWRQKVKEYTIANMERDVRGLFS